MNAGDLVSGLASGATDVSAAAPGTAALLAVVAWAVAQRRSSTAD